MEATSNPEEPRTDNVPSNNVAFSQQRKATATPTMLKGYTIREEHRAESKTGPQIQPI
jgi:hypothetical protein